MNTNVSSPTPVSGLSTATMVAVGAEHSCALRSDGNIVCWGSNLVGQLGNGSSVASSLTPVVVSAF
jgi:alpha-tubulin suppressor-like RCC1 family protein